MVWAGLAVTSRRCIGFTKPRGARPGLCPCAVAPAGQVIGDTGQDFAQDVGGGGEFLGRQHAGVSGGAVDAGHGRRDLGFGGGDRQAGDEVQVADRGAAQVDGVDGQAPAAFGGEEGDDVGGVSRQAGQSVLVAPDAHPGAIGAQRRLHNNAYRRPQLNLSHLRLFRRRQVDSAPPTYATVSSVLSCQFYGVTPKGASAGRAGRPKRTIR